jgi:hypothetical protein
MQTLFLVASMVLAVGTPEGDDMKRRALSCLEVLEGRSQEPFVRELSHMAARCGPVFTRPSCGARFREFHASTARRSTLRSLYAACREEYCDKPGSSACPGEASEDPRVLLEQWGRLSLSILEREVGGSTARRIHDRLHHPEWTGAEEPGHAPAVVRMSGKEGSFRLELFLDGKRAGSWKLSEPPTPSEYTALLAILDEKRPGDFSLHIKATREVVFGHLKLLMASLATQGFHSFDFTVEKDAPSVPAK